MRSVHYMATETRTLCGALYSPHGTYAPTWSEFLALYEREPERSCIACLRTATKYQHLSRSLAMLNQQLDRSPFYLKKR